MRHYKTVQGSQCRGTVPLNLLMNCCSRTVLDCMCLSASHTACEALNRSPCHLSAEINICYFKNTEHFQIYASVICCNIHTVYTESLLFREYDINSVEFYKKAPKSKHTRTTSGGSTVYSRILVQFRASERVSRVIWFSSGLQSAFRESFDSVRGFRARYTHTHTHSLSLSHTHTRTYTL